MICPNDCGVMQQEEGGSLLCVYCETRLTPSVPDTDHTAPIPTGRFTETTNQVQPYDYSSGKRFTNAQRGNTQEVL